MANQFEVYIARYEGRVMYVGEGRKGRNQHINSGISHLYDANKYYFDGKILDVEVIPVESKKKAEQIERELIKEHKPLWNVDGTLTKNRRNTIRRIFKQHPSVDIDNSHYIVKILSHARNNLVKDSLLLISDNGRSRNIHGCSFNDFLIRIRKNDKHGFATYTDEYGDRYLFIPEHLFEPKILKEFIRNQPKNTGDSGPRSKPRYANNG